MWTCGFFVGEGAPFNPTTQPKLGAVHGVLSEAPVHKAVHGLTIESCLQAASVQRLPLLIQLSFAHSSGRAGPIPTQPRVASGKAWGCLQPPREMPSSDVWVSFVVTSSPLYGAGAQLWPPGK